MRKASSPSMALLLVLLNLSVSAFAPVPVARQRINADCRVLSSRRVPVLLKDGRQVYVEPNAVVQSGERILVAGFPSYVWARKGSSRVDSRNVLFGIVVSPDGSADFIPSPLPAGHMSDVRAVALPNGNWAATFADVAPETQFNRKTMPRVDGYWFGITDGKVWLVLQRVPNTGGVLRPLFASRLVQSSIGYSIAIPIELGHNMGGSARTAAAVFTKGEHGWTRRDRVFEFVSYVSLDTTASGNLLLGAVAVDTTDFHVANRLTFYTFFSGDSAWRELTRLETNTSQAIHHPDVIWSGDSIIATWLQATGENNKVEAKIGVGIAQRNGPRIETISPDASQTIPLGNMSRRSWVALEQIDSVSRRIVFAQATANNRVSKFEIPDPFSGFIGAVGSGAKLSIVGPIFSKNPDSPIVSSHLLTVEFDCSLGR